MFSFSCSPQLHFGSLNQQAERLRDGTLMVSSSVFLWDKRGKNESWLNLSSGKLFILLFMMLSCKRSLAEGLFHWSLVRHIRMKLSSSSEYIEGILWKSFSVILLLRDAMSFAVKGGLCAAISYSTHPSDQTSLFPSQGLSIHTSGLVQYGVPVWVRANPVLQMIETFMSANLASDEFLDRRILAGLMSR